MIIGCTTVTIFTTTFTSWTNSIVISWSTLTIFTNFSRWWISWTRSRNSGGSGGSGTLVNDITIWILTYTKFRDTIFNTVIIGCTTVTIFTTTFTSWTNSVIILWSTFTIFTNFSSRFRSNCSSFRIRNNNWSSLRSYVSSGSWSILRNAITYTITNLTTTINFTIRWWCTTITILTTTFIIMTVTKAWSTFLWSLIGTTINWQA